MIQRYCVLLAVCYAAGCGASAGPPPEPVYPVTGKVTFNGQPVVGADVTFMNSEKNRSAFGRTDSDGSYKLTTFTSNDGAVEGKAIVTISKFVSTTPAAPEPGIDSEEYEPPGYGAEEPDLAAGKSEIPDRYASEATSGLVAMVGNPGPTTLDFELEP